MKYAKTFVCFANSRKHSGRCVAGKEWLDGRPGEWVRVVSDWLTHELSATDRRYENGDDPQLLDVKYLSGHDGPYEIPQAVLCVSLGDPFQGHYYKLIASVLHQEALRVNSMLYTIGHQAMESRLLAVCKLPEGDMFTNRAEYVSDAYRIRGEQVAYQDKAEELVPEQATEQDERQDEEDANP